MNVPVYHMPAATNNYNKLIFIALLSRICVVILQFVFNLLIPDHESDAFISPIVRMPRNVYDNIVHWFLSGFLRWDAQYFLHISAYGYVYENTLAFFPGFPVCVRIIATPLQIIFYFLNVTSVYLISSITLNIAVFVLTTRTLFFLSLRELKNEKLAFTTVVLFCINPASVFFTAPYSETLYSYLSFSSMLYEHPFQSSAFVALSALVRSNGIVNLGFPLYRELKYFINNANRNVIKLFFLTFSICFCSLSGIVAYQMYCFSSFCSLYRYSFDNALVHLASEKKYILKGSYISNMCNSTLPYFYIQNQYWNVGFLHYFELKQLPNFILAFPIIYFITKENFHYFIRNRHILRYLGMISRRNDVDINIFPYIVHSTFLLLVCLFFVHIQVSTRLLCSSTPAVYWFFAKLLHREEKGPPNFYYRFFWNFSPLTKAILAYFLLYYVCGTALFCNFYPWT